MVVWELWIFFNLIRLWYFLERYWTRPDRFVMVQSRIDVGPERVAYTCFLKFLSVLATSGASCTSSNLVTGKFLDAIANLIRPLDNISQSGIDSLRTRSFVNGPDRPGWGGGATPGLRLRWWRRGATAQNGRSRNGEWFWGGTVARGASIWLWCRWEVQKEMLFCQALSLFSGYNDD